MMPSRLCDATLSSNFRSCVPRWGTSPAKSPSTKCATSTRKWTPTNATPSKWLAPSVPRNRSNSRFAEPALQRTQKGNQLVLLRWCQTVEIAGQPSSCSSTVEHEALKNVQRRWRVIVPGNLDMLNHFCNEYGFSHEGNGLFQDEQKWREFVAKTNMDWAQYW